MSTGNIILTSIIWIAAILAIVDYFALNKDVQKDNYSKMKQRLLKLLRKDGYKYEMEEGHIILTYHQEHFVLHFDDSQFGKRYARVTIADYYVVDGMDEVHPFVMDAVMGRATHNSTRTPNIAYEKSCLCYYATDVRNIKHFYRGLRITLDMLINNESAVHQDFALFRRDFGRKREASEDKHIGFRTASEEKAESVHQVAAETNVTTTD